MNIDGEHPLKWPSSTEDIRENLLESLEIKIGEHFNGNLWQMVKWAKAHGYAEILVTPPSRSLSNQVNNQSRRSASPR